MYLLGNEPDFPNDFDEKYGMKDDYKGLGVYVHRDKDEEEFKVFSNQNKGLTRTLPREVMAKNTKSRCRLIIDRNDLAGVQIKILYDYIYLSIKDEFGEWKQCMASQIIDPTFHYFAIVGHNLKAIRGNMNSIEIEKVEVKNFDPNV